MIRARSRIGALALAAVAMAMAACYDSAVPLDPVAQTDMDPALVGTWRCLPANPSATDEPATLTVSRASNRMFAVTFQEGNPPPDRYEAHASLVKGRPLVNLRDLSVDNRKPWSFVRYELLRPNLLLLQMVDADALKSVEASPDALRKSIERLTGQASLYVDCCVCVRQKQD